ncbi:hypothetical protein JXI42_06530, partial [bacterium]|nr:hypothetical protein [bacterium]
SPTSEIKIRWNVFENIRSIAIDVNDSPARMEIYNNNILKTGQLGISVWGAESNNTKSFNNIFEENGMDSMEYYGAFTIDRRVDSTVVKYNIFKDNYNDFPRYCPPGVKEIVTTNINGDSCDTFFNLFGYDPLLDTTTFYLNAGSPCINAGDPSLVWDPDSTIPDIGAHFYDTVTVVFSIILNRGWNMVSIPIRNINTNVNSVFPGHIPYIWTFNSLISRYISIDRIQAGVGYFVFYPFDTPLSFRGIPVNQFTDTLSAGWHIIGTPWSEDSISIDSIITIPPGSIIEGSLYRYDNESGEYISEENIIKPNGYWILLGNDCIIIIEGR